MQQDYSRPFDTQCHYIDSPTAVDAEGLYRGVTAYSLGVSADTRPELPGYNSGVLCIVIAMLLLVIFNVKHYALFFKTMSQNLLSVRERPNAFDDHTLNETRIMVVLVIQVCACEAILIFSGLLLAGIEIPPNRFPVVIGLLTGGTLIYYLLQLLAYGTIGYVFTDATGASQWLKGFNATQALLGFLLLVPALAVLFYPAAALSLISISALLYILARIVFICKGFRIFYHNFSSLLYFILYLCTVEIIPVLLVYRGAFSLCRLLLN